MENPRVVAERLMGLSLIESLMRNHNRRMEDIRYAFRVDQEVCVRKHVLDDGQTSEFWIGVRCTIISRSSGMIYGTLRYKLLHPNGCVDSFEEAELDHRFCKKKELV